MKKIEMKEIKDGLLISNDKVVMKARDPELFPEYIVPYFQSKERVQYKKIEFGLEKVTVKQGDRQAIFDIEKIKYMKELGRVDCFLSNVALPGGIETYPLFVKYRFGWLVFAPLEVA